MSLEDDEIGGDVREDNVERIRVIIAEDTFLVREALVQVFDGAPEFEIVGLSDNLDDLMQSIKTLSPHVVVSDIRMPPTGVDEGIMMAESLRESHPEIGVVIVSQYLDSTYVLRLFERGSSGRAYLLKDRVADRNQLRRAVEQVAEGGSMVDPLVVDALVTARDNVEHSKLSELTPREWDVLARVAEGKSNATIAEELYLTKRAVEKYVHAIFVKLDMPDDVEVSRRVKATLLYLRQGSPELR
jgi:DNA-binding NarL/FixJ family response regulator